MKPGVIYQDRKTKITMSVSRQPYNDLLFDVELLNTGSGSKVWFSFYFGHLAETITFLNMAVKAVNNIKVGDMVVLDADHVLTTKMEDNEKYLCMISKNSIGLYTRDEMVVIRDEFLKQLKNI